MTKDKSAPEKVGVVYMLEWDEFERGWGRRPDGTSFHASKESCADFLKAFYAKRGDGPAPNEYESPSSDTPRAVAASLGFVKWVEEKDRRLGRSSLSIKSGAVVLGEDLREILAPYEVLAEREKISEAAVISKSSSPSPRI